MDRSILAVTVAIVMTARPAAAAPPDPNAALQLPLEGQRGDAALLAFPDNDQLQREYPRVALQLNLTGEAAMTCTIKLDGLLADCRVVGESPLGMGFGAATLRMAAYFKARPATLDGKPVESEITIPIRFQLGAAAAHPNDEAIPPPTSPGALSLARQAVALEDDGARMRSDIGDGLKQLTAYAVAGGDAAQGERVEDAYRQAAESVVSDELDRRARLMAATMTADQLRPTLAFLQTPAGIAFRRARSEIEDVKRVSGLWARITQKARASICGAACVTQTAQAPSP